MGTQYRQSKDHFLPVAQRVATATLCLFLLSACSSLNEVKAWFVMPSTGGKAVPPPTEVVKPVEGGVSALPTPMDTFRQLSPPEGLKFTPLFSEPLADADRIRRLEDAVQKMRDDFDTVVPAMVRMVAIEKDMKGLIAELRTLTEGGQVAPPTPAAVAAVGVYKPATAPVPPPQQQPVAAPVPATPSVPSVPPGAVVAESPAAISWIGNQGQSAPPPPSTPPVAPQQQPVQPSYPLPAGNAPIQISPSVMPQQQPYQPPPELSPAPVSAAPPEAQMPVSGAEARGVRISDYPDKTRLVLDMSANGGAVPRIENNGRTLAIDLAQMPWRGPKSWDADSAELISGYRVDKNMLYVDLMYPSKIMAQDILPAIPENPNVRLMLDLFSPEVHKAPR